MDHYQQLKCKNKFEFDQYMLATDKYNSKGNKDMNHKKPESDLYPWLAKDDPRRFQTDAEILYDKIDLSDSTLTRKEKAKLMKMLLKYPYAFSLRDEIGECPNLKEDIKVIDESPFFVRPFPLSESDKSFMDKQM